MTRCVEWRLSPNPVVVVGMVQFHQSYSYEDFIQGYRPTGGGLVLRDGLSVDFCRRAAQDPTTRHVFTIDEINRGDLSKVFGELLMLIEGGKRGGGCRARGRNSVTSR